MIDSRVGLLDWRVDPRAGLHLIEILKKSINLRLILGVISESIVLLSNLKINLVLKSSLSLAKLNNHDHRCDK